MYSRLCVPTLYLRWLRSHYMLCMPGLYYIGWRVSVALTVSYIAGSTRAPLTPRPQLPSQRGRSAVSGVGDLSLIVRCVVEVIAVAVARVVLGAGDGRRRGAMAEVLSSSLSSE